MASVLPSIVESVDDISEAGSLTSPMGSRLSNEEFCRDTAANKFVQDRARLSKVRKAVKGPQDPFNMNYSYLPWVPSKHDVAPSVPYFINPQIYRMDREYSNKPPYLHAYDKRLFRRQPNLFTHDPDYSTCTYTPPDPSLAHIDNQYLPADMDALFKYRSPFRASENPYGELTDPLNLPIPKHENPDPYNVHFLNERGFFKPRTTDTVIRPRTCYCPPC